MLVRFALQLLFDPEPNEGRGRECPLSRRRIIVATSLRYAQRIGLLLSNLTFLDYRLRTVTLSEQSWHVKIVGKHPRVIDHLDGNIPRAVQSPSFVNHDKSFENRRCHYLELPRNIKGKQRFLKVVIEYNGDATRADVQGKIISIYIASGVPMQETRAWP